MASDRQQGQFIQADFFENLAGLNITDSPFKVASNQAIKGYNYDYTSPGSIKSRRGFVNLPGLNTSIATENTTGLHVHSTTATSNTFLRSTDSILQTINTSTWAPTTVTSDDSSPTSTFFSTETPVVFQQFNTASYNTTWMAGGGLGTGVVLGYNGTSVTTNGAAAPTSSGMSAVTNITGTQALATGTYYYAVSLVKASTGAESLAANDLAVSVTNGSNTVVRLTFNLTGLDTTKYNYIKVYRSAISGVSGFTTGSLVTTVSSATTTADDAGAVTSTTNVPRAGYSSLDNSVLGSGTYKTLAVFKRRLVTAQGSTIYFSDINKPESWPTANYIQVPSGGAITGLAVISFNTPTTASTDEFLAIFKDRELWVITGTSISDYSLQFVDNVGCPNQSLIQYANGFLFWLTFSGVHMWDGSGKPVYLSRPLEFDFTADGDIDTTVLTTACSVYHRKQNQIIWFVTSDTLGTNKLAIKLDLRLTLPAISNNLGGRLMDAVFIKDSLRSQVNAAVSALLSSTENIYTGDSSGYLYKAYFDTYVDQGATASYAINFSYKTRPEHFGLINTTKRFHKVIVWAKESTTNNLTLTYWVNYRLNSAFQASSGQQVAVSASTGGVWDQGTWDNAYWDELLVTFTPLVFNLGNSTIGVEGDALTLQFSNSDTNTAIEIAGYSIIYSMGGMRK